MFFSWHVAANNNWCFRADFVCFWFCMILSSPLSPATWERQWHEEVFLMYINWISSKVPHSMFYNKTRLEHWSCMLLVMKKKNQDLKKIGAGKSGFLRSASVIGKKIGASLITVCLSYSFHPFIHPSSEPLILMRVVGVLWARDGTHH